MFGGYETKQVGNKKQMMPEGYTLVFDGSHFFWRHDKSSIESEICWNKWWVRDGAIKHAQDERKLETTEG